MDSTLSPKPTDRHHYSDGVPLAPQDWAGAEEALSKLAHDASDRRARMAESDFSAGLRVTDPPAHATLGRVGVNNDQVPSDGPSLGRRAVRTLASFLLAACIGAASILAWQSYGEAAKQKIASWAPQLGWTSSLLVTNPSPGTEIAAEQPSPLAVQASAANGATAQPAPLAQTAPDTVAPTAPAAPHPELVQQFDAMARDLATMRQGVAQLTASQEQMARNIAKLQAAEQDIRQKISAPPPRPAAAPVRKPVPTLPPPQSAPQVSSAPLAPPLPSPPARPPMPLH